MFLILGQNPFNSNSEGYDDSVGRAQAVQVKDRFGVI